MPSNDKLVQVSRLQNSYASRSARIGATLGVLIPAQIRGIRFNRGLKQRDIAKETGMLQSRISAVETPGASLNVETLVRLAAAYKLGLVVKFVPFSEMLSWENSFNQDAFAPTTIDEDFALLSYGQTWPANPAMNMGFIASNSAQFVTTTAPDKQLMLGGLIASTTHYDQPAPVAGIHR